MRNRLLLLFIVILTWSLCFLLSACVRSEGTANSNNDLNHELDNISIQFIEALYNRDEKTLAKLALPNELIGLIGNGPKLTKITPIDLKQENEKYINTLIVNTSDKSTSFIYHICFKKVQGNWKIIDFESLGLNGDFTTDDISTTTLVLGIANKTNKPIDMEQIISILKKRAAAFGASNIEIKDIEQNMLQVQLSGLSDEFIKMMFHRGRLEFITEQGQVVATNSDILKASSKECLDGLMLMDLVFNDEGAKKIAQATSAHVGRRMEIYLDGQLIQNPVILEPITGGKICISQSDDNIPCRALVTYLNFGPLPCDIEIMEKRTVGGNRR